MNRVERRERDLINPYSTALALVVSFRPVLAPAPHDHRQQDRPPGTPAARGPRVGGGPSEGSGSQYPPSFPQAPNPGEQVPCLGSAKPIACDATTGSDLDTVAASRTVDRREDGTAQHRFVVG